jgi:hypothetical protein
MAGSSRQHRGVKRRKELDRKARQEEKRQRKTERKNETPGSGPPIDWEAAELGPSTPARPEAEMPADEAQAPHDPQDPHGPETP